MGRKKIKAILLLTLLTTITSLCPIQEVSAATVKDTSVSNNNLSGLEEVFLRPIQEYADSRYDLNKDKNAVARLIKNNGVNSEINNIKSYIEDVDENAALLNLDSKNPYKAKFDQTREKLYSSLVLIVENMFKITEEKTDSTQITSSKKLANELKQYFINDRNLKSSKYVKSLNNALKSLSSKEVSIYVNDASNRLNEAIKGNDSKKLLDNINFSKDVKKTLITDYKLTENNDSIKKLTNLINKSNNSIATVKASEAISIINDAISSSDLKILTEAKNKALSIKAELIENYGQATDGTELRRIESALSRINSKLNNAGTVEPIKNLENSVTDAVNSGDYEALKRTITDGISLKGKFSDNESLSRIDKALQSGIIQLGNILINEITNFSGNKSTKFKDTYNFMKKVNSYKEFIDGLGLKTNDIYKNRLDILQEKINNKLIKNDANKIIDAILKEASDSNNYEVANNLLEECKYIRLFLIDNYKMSPTTTEIQTITDKIINQQQKLNYKRYEKEEVIDPVINPNWAITGLPQKILVREKQANINNIVIDIYANENMTIEGNRLIFVDSSNAEETWDKTVTVFSNMKTTLKGYKIRDIDGKIVNSLSDLSKRSNIQTGDLLFSVIFPTRAHVVNRTYWQRLQSTKAGKDDEVTLTATMSAEKSESITKSLTKTLGIEESFSAQAGIEVGTENMGSASSGISASSAVSRSFETTFERSFSVGDGFERSIQHTFNNLKENSKVGLYQMVEEVEVLNAEGAINTIKYSLSKLNLTVKAETKVEIKTSRFNPIVADKEDRMLK